jgi:hypothetical protein
VKKANDSIDRTFNYDNEFFRMIHVGLCSALNKRIRWINRFEDGTKIRVLVPFYTPFAGDSRYIFDAFIDDIVDKRVEQNTDQIPRGVITSTSISPVSAEFANPNQYLSQTAKINEKIRRIISKVKAVPVRMNYDIEVMVSSELDAQKFTRKMMYTFFNWYFYSIEYYGLKIDCFFELPDDKTIEIVREIKIDTYNKTKRIKFPITVASYIPIFQVDIDDLEICNNDDEINWDYLEINRPIEDFRESLNELYHTKTTSSSEVQKVFWTAYQYHTTQYPYIKDETNKPWSVSDFKEDTGEESREGEKTV